MFAGFRCCDDDVCTTLAPVPVPALVPMRGRLCGLDEWPRPSGPLLPGVLDVVPVVPPETPPKAPPDGGAERAREGRSAERRLLVRATDPALSSIPTVCICMCTGGGREDRR